MSITTTAPSIAKPRLAGLGPSLAAREKVSGEFEENDIIVESEMSENAQPRTSRIYCLISNNIIEPEVTVKFEKNVWLKIGPVYRVVYYLTETV